MQYSEIKVPSRFSVPDVRSLEVSELDTPIFLEEIITIEGPSGDYYEGIDHSEAVLMLKHLVEKTGAEPEKIILVNIDAHDDVSQWKYTSGRIELGTWVRAVFEGEAINRSIGVFWIFRQSTHFFFLDEDEKFAVTDDFDGKGVKVTLMNFDDMTQDQDCLRTFNHLLKLKEMGYQLIVSIDADAGRQEDPDSEYDRDLSNTPWLRELCKASTAVMFFHSQGFCDPDYAEQQAVAFRKLHQNGYVDEQVETD